MFFLRKRYAVLAIATAALIGGIAVLRVYAGTAQESAASPPMSVVAVDVATVESQTITDWHD